MSADLLEGLAGALGVSAAALFYSPEEKSADDSVFALVDTVVGEELARAAMSIRRRIRRR